MWITLGTLVIVLVSVGCSGPAMRIQTDYEREAVADVGRYRTYAWQLRPGQNASDAVTQQVVQVADRVLQSKGYTRTDGDPDFTVSWQITQEKKQRVSTVEPMRSVQPGIRASGGPSYQPTMTLTSEYAEGTLVLDILDGRSGRPVWRGSATADITKPLDPPAREERIREATRRVAERFPPRP